VLVDHAPLAVLSPVDVSIPGVISCRLIQVPEWVELGLDLGKAVIKAIAWLESA